MADRTAFTRDAATRIAKVVRQVESGDRQAKGLSYTPRLQQLPPSKEVRFCSWTVTWPHADTATITFASGAVNTATATNVILGVGPGDGWVTKKGSAGWTLVSFDMTKQPGYFADEIQLFGHSSSSAIAQWYSITTCATT